MFNTRFATVATTVLLLVGTEVSSQNKQQEASIKDYQQVTEAPIHFAIPPIFQDVQSFNDGLAAVKIDNKWGFIDKTGKIVVEPSFNSTEGFFEFSDGLAAISYDTAEKVNNDLKLKKWGFIDKTGKIVIKPKFYRDCGIHCPKFSEGLAAISADPNLKRYGFIDKAGKFVIQPKFEWASNFNDGLARVTVDGKTGYINKQGEFVIPPIYFGAEDFSEGLAAVTHRPVSWFFIDKSGARLTNKSYQIVSPFSNGLARVQQDNRYEFIDKRGEAVLSLQDPWKSYNDPKSIQAYLIQRKFSDERLVIRKDEKFGFIDKTGNIVISPQFEEATPFYDGVALVKKVDKGYFFVNKSGERISQYIFNELGYRSEGFLQAKGENGKWGFIKAPEISTVRLDENPTNRLNLVVQATKPSTDGSFTITVKTNTDTTSLKVNDEEYGGRKDGNYTIKKVARIGQDTEFSITAVDINGNSDTKTISVSRQPSPSTENQISILKPENLKLASRRDAVAIIIGIQNYKRVPKAEFATNDAKEFYEYAVRALGVAPEKIKLLLDEEADDVNIVKAFENWLPIQVNKDKTDVYVFYSGHGLPASDGKSLYLLPHGVDKELLSRTAVGQNEIVAALSAAKPKSVTMFIDACYSGQTRGGDVLVANAKPLSLKSDLNAYPPNFIVITASANDQMSSSSPELKHGIFSFYLMKGMEGEADANKDGKITVGEMQEYLSDKVSRQAMTLNRKQTTQLVGDAGRVLVGK